MNKARRLLLAGMFLSAGLVKAACGNETPPPASAPPAAASTTVPGGSQPVAGGSDSVAAGSATVGRTHRIEQLVLPGSQLEAKPISDRLAPIMVRVVSVYPHGAAFRYDLEWSGFAPGTYDLRDYLRRADGSSTDDIPPMPVQVASLLPPGQSLPHSPRPQRAPWLGGYRAALVGVGLLWIAGLLAILLAGRRRRRAAERVEERPLTVAERLEPLVASAAAGPLSTTQQAELERLLLAYWRERLQLETLEPSVALAQLKAHSEAGGLLRLIEDWLHRPEGAGDADIAAALAPYRRLATPAPSAASKGVSA